MFGIFNGRRMACLVDYPIFEKSIGRGFGPVLFVFRDINTLIYEIKIIFNGGLNYVERN